MTVVLGAIADDFTGATDLAGLLARSGARVNLRIGVPDGDPDPADVAPFEVIALKIRTVPAAQAVTQARAALRWLRAAGAPRTMWKYCSTFDSTAKGNIGPVAEALMGDLGARQTIYCPSFPENGRTVYMGRLFVGRQPLDESPMRDHPLTPMRDADLTRLLAPQVARPVGLADRATVAAGADALRRRLEALQADGIAHVVVDAITDDDLQTVALACRDMPLITGGSAVAMSLPALYAEAGTLEIGRPEAGMPSVGPGAVVLSGSCSEMTRKQVAQFLQDGVGFHVDPLALDRGGLQDALEWLKTRSPDAPVLFYATAAPGAVRAAQAALGPAKAGEAVEDALGRLAVAARDAGRRRFVVAGGETSGAVTTALGVDRLTVGAEIAPGVPWTAAQSGGHAIALALKSGNFGAAGFFADALAALP